jgi:hypothetical protein
LRNALIAFAPILLLAVACGDDNPGPGVLVAETPTPAATASATLTATPTPTGVVVAATETPTAADTPTPGATTESWIGNLTGSIQTAGCDPVSQDGFITLTVTPDGNVTGSGVTDTGAYSCDNGANIGPAQLTYPIAGTKVDRFTLIFTDGVTLQSTVISDNRATIEWDTGAGVITIEFECFEGCE